MIDEKRVKHILNWAYLELQKKPFNIPAKFRLATVIEYSLIILEFMTPTQLRNWPTETIEYRSIFTPWKKSQYNKEMGYVSAMMHFAKEYFKQNMKSDDL